MKTPFTFTILKYIHDVASGESLNVGVVLLAPSQRFLGARIQQHFGRLRKAFPSVDGESHRRLMEYIQKRFNRLKESYENEFELTRPPSSIEELACQILPNDDSALQWSPAGGGLTADPEHELERLYTRFVTANDEERPDTFRSNDEIWSVFRTTLASEKVAHCLEPHKLVTEDDEVEFKHAWKNDLWHCLEPVSFDLSDSERIRSKAHRVLGQMHGIRDVFSNHLLYLIIGEPRIDRSRVAAEKAVSLLRKQLPVPHEIIREADAAEFSRTFAEKVRKHEAA